MRSRSWSWLWRRLLREVDPVAAGLTGRGLGQGRLEALHCSGPRTSAFSAGSTSGVRKLADDAALLRAQVTVQVQAAYRWVDGKG